MSTTWAAFCSILLLLGLAVATGNLYQDNQQLKFEQDTASEVHRALEEDNQRLRKELEAAQQGKIQSDSAVADLSGKLSSCTVALELEKKAKQAALETASTLCECSDTTAEASPIIPGPIPDTSYPPAAPAEVDSVETNKLDFADIGWTAYLGVGAALFTASSIAALFRRDGSVQVRMTRDDATAFRQWQRSRRG